MQQRMEPTWTARDYIRMEGDNANSVYLLRAKGDEWEVVVRFERKPRPPYSIPLLLPEPVRVIKGKDGREEMRYNSSVMERGKIYQTEWNGRQYGLRKTGSEVEILRFYPDDHEQGD